MPASGATSARRLITLFRRSDSSAHQDVLLTSGCGSDRPEFGPILVSLVSSAPVSIRLTAASISQAVQILRRVWNHPANRNRRVRQIRRAICYQARGRLLGKPTLTQIGDYSLMWARLHEPSSSKPLYFNPPDYYEMLEWRRWLRRGDLFIDVGANVGYYSLWAAESGARVVAIEPSSRTLWQLRANVSLNDYDITVLACAIGATPGVVRITTDQGPMNRLALEGEEGEEVTMTTLDLVLDGRSAYVKMDVETAEFAVLMGAHQSLIDKRLKLIQMEWARPGDMESANQFVEFLGAYDYELFRAGPRGLTPAADLDRGGEVFARPVS